jgi:hypothetical protein
MAFAETPQHFDGVEVKLVFLNQHVENEHNDIAVVC